MARGAVLLLLLLLAGGCAGERVRFATFNAALSREAPGAMLAAAEAGDDLQMQKVAEIIQRTRPDVLLLQEVDYDAAGRGVAAFQANYLSVPQNGAEPFHYPYVYIPEVNTGVHSGLDLDNNGRVDATPGSPDYAGDCFGWGLFPGQYGMAVLSRYPIDTANVRTFRQFLWKDLPGAKLPVKEDGTPWYSDEELAVLRLSSKTHAMVPVDVEGKTVTLLIAHPTPPVFDGPEDRNGLRNADEVKLLNSIIIPNDGRSEWLIADDGEPAFLEPRGEQIVLGRRLRPWEVNRMLMSSQRKRRSTEPFVVMGDLNRDPFDGERTSASSDFGIMIGWWSGSPAPASQGGTSAAEQQAGVNDNHLGDPAHDTADWDDTDGPGNLRVDYVLPSPELKLLAAGVFWPTPDDPLFGLVENNASSDHRLVWVDVAVP